MRFKQAIQIGRNVTDIMKLPCVRGVEKLNDKAGFEWLQYTLKHGDIAEESDWLCEDYDGNWSVYSNDEYHGIVGSK